MKHTKHTISVLLIGVLTLSPLSAIAKAGAEVIADDSIAGIGTLVDVHGVTGTDDVTLVVETPAGQTKSVHLGLTNGAGSTTIPGSLTREAGMYTVSVEADGTTIASTTAAVLPETMDPVSSTIETDTRHIDSDGRDEATIDVQLTDRYGNVLPGRPVTLISSRPEDGIVPLSQETDNRGIQSFAVSTREDGTIALRALDLLSGNLLAASVEIEAGYGRAVGNSDVAYSSNTSGGQRLYYAQVSGGFDVIDGFEIMAPATMTAGVEAPKITVSAVDRDGNIVEDYVGTVLFSSTDPDATLPNFGKYTFKSRDLGVKEFPLVLKFRQSGQQTLRVEDQNEKSIAGDVTVTVGGGSQPVTGKTIAITSHKDGDSVNSTTIVLTGKGPSFANLIVMGGAQDEQVSTDEDGMFSLSLALNETQRDFTIRVRDDAGRNDSGPIHLILDQDAPEITDISFSPEEPQAGSKILVTAESDPKLKSLTMSLDKTLGMQDVILKETGSTGSYQAVFTVDQEGSYQPSFVAVDAAGNRSELRATLNIGLPTLPIVQNLTAEPRLSAASLEWDALDIPLDGYRVYVGDKEDNFLYTLDTQSLSTKATVAGLTPGQTYYFAVTALKGDTESKEKSKIAKVDILGLKLDVTPMDGALGIKWSSIKAQVPLASYLLEFGLEGTPYTESRYINGELREFTLRDLLNGVPYSMRLTPVTVTGQKLEDLSATGQGTPSSVTGAFNPSAADPIPFISSTHPGGVSEPAPHTPGSGIPAFAWLLMAAFGTAGVYLRLRHRQKIQKTAAFLSAIQSQYRS